MSVTTETQESVNAAERSDGRIRLAIVLAALCMVALALALRVEAAPSLFYGAASGMAALFIVLLLRPALYMLQRKWVLTGLLSALRDDPTPHFIVTRDGRQVSHGTAAHGLARGGRSQARFGHLSVGLCRSA